MPQLWPRPFGSASVVLPHVVLGRPLPLFPLDVQQIAVLFLPNGVVGERTKLGKRGTVLLTF